MKLSELFYGVNVKSSTCELDGEVKQITSDSIQVLKGGMFICIKGTRCDGYDFVSDALQRGAAVIVAENSDKAMYMAIEGMLPHNTLGAKALTRVRIYKDAEHNNAAQQPEVWNGEIK